MTRLTAISKILCHQASAASHKRFMPEALTLTAGCVWLANGLHARPEDGPAARRLMDAILPVTEADGVSRETLAYNTSVRGREQEEEEEDEEEEGSSRRRVTYNPYGCVFFRRLMLGDAPRLRVGGPILSPPAFKFWFHGLSIEEVTAKYQTTGIIDRKALAIKRPGNKGRMPLYVNWTGVPEPQLFNLAAKGHTLPPSADDGSDMDDQSSSRSASPAPTIDSFLSDLWRQFVIDLTGKSPNPRGATNPAYVKLTGVQRREAKEDIYKNPTLSDVFHAVAYRSASREDWMRAFKWLFPKPGHKTTTATQNYPTCPYFRTWMSFIDDPKHDEVLIKDVRQEIWKRLREWSWIPDAQQDKMWPTGSLAAFTRWPQPNGPINRPAPRILLREGMTPLFEEVIDL